MRYNVGFVGVLYAKVINDEGEHDGVGSAPE
jgi:hypothetical protein